MKKLVTIGDNLWADTLVVTPATLKEVHQGKTLTTLLYPLNKQARRVRPLMVLLLDYPRLKATDLAGIAAPTLVLAGKKDVIQLAHPQLIASSLPHGRAHVFPVSRTTPRAKTRPPLMRRCWRFWRSRNQVGLAMQPLVAAWPQSRGAAPPQSC